MSKRRIVGLGIVLIAIILIAGCGFYLRNLPTEPDPPVITNGDEPEPVWLANLTISDVTFKPFVTEPRWKEAYLNVTLVNTGNLTSTETKYNYTISIKIVSTGATIHLVGGEVLISYLWNGTILVLPLEPNGTLTMHQELILVPEIAIIQNPTDGFFIQVTELEVG